VDATDLYAIPGLTDLHFHGCMGEDFCNGTFKAIQTLAEYEAVNGITTICPATMTLPLEQLEAICKTAVAYNNSNASENGALLVGINLEGPFLSLEKKGAQNAQYLIEATMPSFLRLNTASNGLARLICVAPEIGNNLEFIKKAKDMIHISIAHTTANYDTAIKAFENGATQVTHLFNAMTPFSHRNPGVVGAAADTPTVKVELICDGVHIHPSMIRSAFKLFTDERILLISDSMQATGMPDGEYTLGGQQVFVNDSHATLKDGTIAGSTTNLMGCVQFLVKEIGIPLESAIKCAAVNPAKAIGIYDSYGSLTPGKVANVVLLNKNLEVVQVYLKGVQILRCNA
jgi:N-acetylglucosamine-6-phosphate deacetylase